MLVLTRKHGESITIGDNIRITFLDIQNKSVKIGIQAPKHIHVHREEIYNKIVEENRKAIQESAPKELLQVAKVLQNKQTGERENIHGG